jgi:SynChlorMet cassette protein ScmD
MEQMDKPIANPVVVLREEFDDWAILFNPDTAGAVGINPVGVSIWKLMDGRLTIPEIANRIKDHLESVPAEVVDHVTGFIAQLAQQGFVGYELEAFAQ